ncbi:epididymis-specific alpha- [Lynx pardinus]|uniref:Epididymis-specific alpha n=1 Tax=Lynx pardinus TaxID=191816 RepID=A0A485N499_LYNPA|nr:epididymis-specific alpha- [Lynx pardinus]
MQVHELHRAASCLSLTLPRSLVFTGRGWRLQRGLVSLLPDGEDRAGDTESNRTVQVTREFMEYHVNNDMDLQPISNNYASAPNETAKHPWKPVGMQIVAGELRTKIQQYLYRCTRAP